MVHGGGVRQLEVHRVARMCHERLPAAWLSLSPSLRQRPTSLAVTLGRRVEQWVLRRGGIPSGRF